MRYDRLRDPARLEQLRVVVAGFAAALRPTAARDRLALWSNAYNANVLLMAFEASRRPGFVNVEKVPGFFDATPIVVAGERLTLNRLENDRIRPLGDARIHAALVCAAMSCPPLRAEPYTAARLDAQLDDQSRRWVNDPAKFRVIGGRVGLSAILDWYGVDFTAAPYGSPLGYVKHYADASSALGRLLATTRTPPTATLPYDWTLNRAGG
ncbi:MAG: DUF547 domain-containing protein [Phycisphaerales bacterium]|nr:DUF547 domain-containing protein [Phycisphaerales bacterium]